MEIDLRITEHAYQRAKERLNWKKKTLDRMVKKAFNQGLKWKDTKGSLKEFLQWQRRQHPETNQIRIYGEHVFYFSNFALITMYRLDNGLLKFLKER